MSQNKENRQFAAGGFGKVVRLRDNIYSFGIRPVKPPKRWVPLGFDPDSPWVCYSNRGRLTFLPREIADEFDFLLSYRGVGLHRIFGVEEIEAMRVRVALFGLSFATWGEFAHGLAHVQREGDVLDDTSRERRVAA